MVEGCIWELELETFLYICFMKVNCANCGKEIDRYPSLLKKSKTGNLYCSKSCSNSVNNRLFKSGQNHPNYKTGESSYRKIIKKDSVCERCGFKDIRALQVHHKDRDRHNNKRVNLEILCANCHMIEHSK